MSTVHPVEHVAAGGVRFALRRVEPAGPSETPVLLLHGVPQTGAVWDGLAARLGADRLVLAPDLPGLGDSELVASYDVGNLAGALAALVLHESERVGWSGPVDVVGHDWGGVLALGLAGLRPDLVRRVVVVSAPYRGLDPHAVHVPFFALPGLPEVVLRLGGGRLVRAMVRGTWRAATAPDPAALDRWAAAYADPARVAAMLGYYRAAVRGWLRGAGSLARVRAERHLVVWGAADPVLPLGVGERVVRDLGPRTTLVSLPGVGHWPVEEDPEVVLPVIENFLRESAGERPRSVPPAD